MSTDSAAAAPRDHRFAPWRATLRDGDRQLRRRERGLHRLLGCAVRPSDFREQRPHRAPGCRRRHARRGSSVSGGPLTKGLQDRRGSSRDPGSVHWADGHRRLHLVAGALRISCRGDFEAQAAPAPETAQSFAQRRSGPGSRLGTRYGLSRHPAHAQDVQRQSR